MNSDEKKRSEEPEETEQVAQLPQRDRATPLSQLKSCQLLHNCTKNHI